MSDEDCLRVRFDAVYCQHNQCLLGYAAGQGKSPRDLLQTAYVKGWTWFLRHPTATNDLLRAMLFDYIRWTAIDEGRHRQRSPIIASIGQEADGSDNPFENVAADGPLPDELANSPDLANLVRAARERMKNAKMRTLLELLYVDPKPSLQEVAEKMKISIANAKKLHERAKNALKKTLLSLAKEMNIATETQHNEP